MIKIIFVCTGNICRSPTAEYIFKDLIKKKNKEKYFLIESRGIIADESGLSADTRALKIAKENNIDMKAHRASLLKKADLDSFNYCFALAKNHYDHMKNMKKSDNIIMFSDFDSDENNKGKDVKDPYFDSIDEFREVFFIINRICLNLEKTLKI